MGPVLSLLRKPEEDNYETERRLVNAPLSFCSSVCTYRFTAHHLSCGGGLRDIKGDLEEGSDAEESVLDGRWRTALRGSDAGIEAGRPWFGVDSIQKRMHPKFEELGPNPSPGKRQAALKEVEAELYYRTWCDPSYQPLGKPKHTTHCTGIRDRTSSEPRWTNETSPLAQNVDPDNDSWWKQDHQLKIDIVSRWLDSEDASNTFPRFSNTLNSRQQNNGVEIALSRLFEGVDYVKKQLEDQEKIATAVVRAGRMSKVEADMQVEMARANLREAEEELLEVLEFA